MKRKIIKIDEAKCDGCGLCVPDCPEGALQIIDNKARLVSDLFCDGLGACLGTCPQGAIEVEEREAEPYDEKIVMANIVKQGANVIEAHLTHLKEHNETGLLNQALEYLQENNIAPPAGFSGKEKSHGHAPHKGCPGAAAMDMRQKAPAAPQGAPVKQQSALQNWPIQMTLLNPHAPYLKNADLLVSADCVPFAFPNFHQRFLQGKVMMTFCPKLDQNIEDYVEKLAVIFRDNDIKSVSVVHMEVPCCTGTVYIVQKALEKAQKVVPLKDYTISISGEII
ncbi:MAG: 4Fe-4S dicluster domain-containing protein [bacterium]|nr:4Fe-4S dicluster domain-containing protein [bacterium]